MKDRFEPGLINRLDAAVDRLAAEHLGWQWAKGRSQALVDPEATRAQIVRIGRYLELAHEKGAAKLERVLRFKSGLKSWQQARALAEQRIFQGVSSGRVSMRAGHDDSDGKWLALGLAETQAFERLSNSAASRQDLLDWWGSASNVLTEYRVRLHRYGNPPIGADKGSPPPPLTMDLTNRLCNIVGSLAVGDIPEPVRGVTSRGRTPPTPMELNCIQVAVAYHRACTSGGWSERPGVVISINDVAPVKTICEHFGVKRTTVQGWIRSYTPADFGMHGLHRFSADGAADEQELAMPHQAAGLWRHFKNAATTYQSFSRSFETKRLESQIGRSRKKIRSLKRR